MNWSSEVAAGVIGGLAGSVITAFASPFLLRAERAGRAFTGEDPIDVVVDTDQAIIWAGAPPWIGYGYYFKDGLPDEPPPEVPFDWGKWAYRHGGVDWRYTMLQVTLQAKLNTAVVIDTPIIRIVDRTPMSSGRVAEYLAGGADLTPRRFEVDLNLFDPPVVGLVDEDSQPLARAQFKLQAGDVERLQIWVRADGPDLVEWTLELPLIADGKRIQIPIDGPTDKVFRTAGAGSGLSRAAWSSSGWQEYHDDLVDDGLEAVEEPDAGTKPHRTQGRLGGLRRLASKIVTR